MNSMMPDASVIKLTLQCLDCLFNKEKLVQNKNIYLQFEQNGGIDLIEALQ